ncbi:MAG: hypothetical protein AB8H86_21055 [Polyangiales bacterium]
MARATYDQFITALQTTDCSSGVPAELVHHMDDLRLPDHLQIQLTKLLRAGNPDRAAKLVDAYRAHEPLFNKLRRKLGL